MLLIIFILNGGYFYDFNPLILPPLLLKVEGKAAYKPHYVHRYFTFNTTYYHKYPSHNKPSSCWLFAPKTLVSNPYNHQNSVHSTNVCFSGCFVTFWNGCFHQAWFLCVWESVDCVLQIAYIAYNFFKPLFIKFGTHTFQFLSLIEIWASTKRNILHCTETSVKDNWLLIILWSTASSRHFSPRKLRFLHQQKPGFRYMFVCKIFFCTFICLAT